MTCVDAGKIHLGREKRRPIPPPQPLPKGPLILVLRRQSETPREGPALFPSPQETVFFGVFARQVIAFGSTRGSEPRSPSAESLVPDAAKRSAPAGPRRPLQGAVLPRRLLTAFVLAC